MIGSEPRSAEPGTRLAQVDSLPELMRLVHLVPMHLRRFTVTAAAARARHHVGQDLAGLLVAEGLPYIGQGSARLYDDYDLGNLALHLGLPTVRRMSLRSWASNLRRNSERAGNELRVEVVPQCPVTPHGGPCTYQLLQRGGRREPIRAMAGGVPIAHYDACLAGHWPALPAAARELADEAAGLKFFILPEAIRWDLGFVARTGLADCGSVAEWLVRESARRGLRARFSFGLLVAKPYSVPHCWTEFLVDDIWVPYDPLLLNAMRQWAGLDQVSWHRYRSMGAVLYRLCGSFTKIASHGGIWAPLSLPTDYRTESDK
jgi:hypothetical protein